MRLSLFLFLIWPFVEIAGFVLVGREIGVLSTIGLTILMGVLGAALLRYQGFGVLNRIRKEIDAGRSPTRDVVHGIMILVAGFLLLIPGFFSDFLGLLLFVPPIRDIAWKFLSRNVDFSSTIVTSGFPGSRRERTIDLDVEDYSSTPDPDSPWKRIDDKNS